MPFINLRSVHLTSTELATIKQAMTDLEITLADYAYTSYRAGSGTLGYETKKNELKQFFNRSGKTSSPIRE